MNISNLSNTTPLLHAACLSFSAYVDKQQVPTNMADYPLKYLVSSMAKLIPNPTLLLLLLLCFVTFTMTIIKV